MILMDTHIWLRWLLPDEPLSENLIKLIETTEYLAVSSISCWEVVLLEKLHRIELPLPVDEWLKEALIGSAVTALPVTATIASLAGLLPYHHKDPADRFIIATAIHHDMKVVSFDGIFPSYIELNDLLITENL
jgi:PIN domain nuclease of toxin-antitoxin system